MLVPVIVLVATLLVLVVIYVLDDALGTLQERIGQPRKSGLNWSKRLVWLLLALVIAQFFAPTTLFSPKPPPAEPLPQAATFTADSLWSGADTTRLVFFDGEREELVRYGRELIKNTARYIGPNGTVMRNTNALNCQNCHLEAGTKPWGNNYGAVWSTYPKFRARSGANETVVKRVNDCVERSLNGTALDSTGREMKAIIAYMEWLGTGIDKGAKPKGSGIVELAFMDRAADPKRGAEVFEAKCASCHGKDGQGMLKADSLTQLYPPLWGPLSYNSGAGLYRLSRFAGYAKANMPQGATYLAPQLTDEEAWDVAAYVNSQPRPRKDLTDDWPDISKKPVDHPFGPYADKFTEQQHKYGPFDAIAANNKKP
ncbi:MAG: c-type cytochrome [Flavobacteriales bacterium]|nr:c-type cytochrome [Flavobacteriales bacterium]